jgi:MFS family permease
MANWVRPVALWRPGICDHRSVEPSTAVRDDVGGSRDPDAARSVQRTYLVLTLLTTLAASFIWGINTLFLLDAGLNNAEAFAANAFFSVGQVLCEVPTGVVADTRGRRLSFLLGAATLLLSTLLYLVMWQIHAALWGWAIASILLGLGFTFFSGATEAWLIDALNATGFTGELESVFGRAQTVTGVATLIGSVGGGVIAQATNLGVPYVARAAMLGVTLVVAFVFMHDLGFSPRRGASVAADVRTVLRGSIDGGLRNRPVRWLMLAAPFSAGVSFYAFYALQPYLLQLYGDKNAYEIAGLAAALIAAAQILGGLVISRVRRLFARRTDALLLGGALGVLTLAVLGLTGNFALALVLVSIQSLVFALQMPLRQAFMAGLIPSSERATVLSFDSMMGSSGGIVAPPILGRTADVYGYPASYVASAGIAVLALPFVVLARHEHAVSDPIGWTGSPTSTTTSPNPLDETALPIQPPEV